MTEFPSQDDTFKSAIGLIEAFGKSGVTTAQGACNLLRAFGHDVILTPDDEIITIADAPAIELADGRKYKQDGTPYEG
jgi:hypothetical protein